METIRSTIEIDTTKLVNSNLTKMVERLCTESAGNFTIETKLDL